MKFGADGSNQVFVIALQISQTEEIILDHLMNSGLKSGLI